MKSDARMRAMLYGGPRRDYVLLIETDNGTFNATEVDWATVEGDRGTVSFCFNEAAGAPFISNKVVVGIERHILRYRKNFAIILCTKGKEMEINNLTHTNQVLRSLTEKNFKVLMRQKAKVTESVGSTEYLEPSSTSSLQPSAQYIPNQEYRLIPISPSCLSTGSAIAKWRRETVPDVNAAGVWLRELTIGEPSTPPKNTPPRITNDSPKAPPTPGKKLLLEAKYKEYGLSLSEDSEDEIDPRTSSLFPLGVPAKKHKKKSIYKAEKKKKMERLFGADSETEFE